MCNYNASSKLYTFHQTAIGHLHVMRGIPCEDHSLSYSDDEGRYHIAVVADGHGSSECFRSNIGSKMACERAMALLKVFADSVTDPQTDQDSFFEELLGDTRSRQTTVHRLTDAIIAGWHDAICAYHEEHPVSEAELDVLTEKYGPDKTQAITEHVEHIYGTTLMAAVAFAQCVLLIHQGDGRIDVFYEDGTVDQPVPWDERCQENMTTSMCDADVTTSIRHTILDFSEKKVIACFLGSDGVEDAYRDSAEDLGGSHGLMAGVHTFYKYLACQCVGAEREAFEQMLEGFLPEFSANGLFSRSGSGDDVSVAGILDLEGIAVVKEQFEQDIRMYQLEEELFWKEDELRGKTRKHGILKKRLADAKASMDALILEKDKIQAKIEALEAKNTSLIDEIASAKEALDNYKEEAESETESLTAEEAEGAGDSSSLKSHMKLLGLTLQDIYERITNGLHQLEAAYKMLVKQQAAYEETLAGLQQEGEKISAALAHARQNYEEAKENFEAYDDNYKKIESECHRIRCMIDAVKMGLES